MRSSADLLQCQGETSWDEAGFAIWPLSFLSPKKCVTHYPLEYCLFPRVYALIMWPWHSYIYTRHSYIYIYTYNIHRRQSFTMYLYVYSNFVTFLFLSQFLIFSNFIWICFLFFFSIFFRVPYFSFWLLFLLLSYLFSFYLCCHLLIKISLSCFLKKRLKTIVFHIT